MTAILLALTVFVNAATGSDAGDGSQAKPYRTLVRTRDAALERAAETLSASELMSEETFRSRFPDFPVLNCGLLQERKAK